LRLAGATLYTHYLKARIMFNKLLVPLDGTTDAAVALPAATTLARATGASNHIGPGPGKRR